MDIRVCITVIKGMYGLCSSLELIRMGLFSGVKRLGFHLIFIQFIEGVMIGIKRVFIFVTKMTGMATVKTESF